MTREELIEANGRLVGRDLGGSGSYGYPCRSGIVIPALVDPVRGKRVWLTFHCANGTRLERMCSFSSAVSVERINTRIEDIKS